MCGRDSASTPLLLLFWHSFRYISCRPLLPYLGTLTLRVAIILLLLLPCCIANIMPDDLAQKIPGATNSVLQSILDKLGLDTLPPHPVSKKGTILIHFKTLHCDSDQLRAIEEIYMKSQHYHRAFTESASSQQEARDCLQGQGLNIDDLGDLANGWSRRWSTSTTSKGLAIRRILFQW